MAVRNNSSNGTSKKTSSRAGGKTSSSSRAANSATKSNGNGEENRDQSLLQELFLDALKDIYWAEKHLVKALGKMQKQSTTEELREAFADHQEVTRGHVERLEEAFALLDKKPQAKKCEAMEGLTKEAEDIMEETEKGSVTRDVGLIMAAQKVEHYEIATYGSLAQLARTLGNEEMADLMDGILEEEKEADQLLTEIAENNINIEATAE
jgi:ferritin-like metal-binding protein YciE